MPTIDEVVDHLARNNALRLGESPWKPDIDFEEHEIFSIDWRKIFPGKNPSTGRNTDWDSNGDDWDLDNIATDEIEEIFRPLSPLERSNHERPQWDICAWYQPIHFHGYDWGIFIRQDCLLRLARKIRIELLKSCPSAVSQNRLFQAKAFLRGAFTAYYHHEVYHHKTECFGLRLHVIQKKSSYLPYYSQVYMPNRGTDDQLEEAIANAFMYRSLFLDMPWIPRDVLRATQEYLCASFPHDPPGYRKAVDYLGKRRFESGQHLLLCRAQEASVNPICNRDDWKIAPRINQSFFNIQSDIYTVVRKGQKSILPTSAISLSTCSTSDMIRICQGKGYATIPGGGKGSHIKMECPGRPVVIIPGNRSNLSPGVAKNILTTIGGYKIKDIPMLM